MLVLSRLVDQVIIIGDSIEITVLAVKGDKVKIGVKAPLDIPVHRKEIYLAIKQENIEAAAIDAGELEKAAGILSEQGKNARDRTE